MRMAGERERERRLRRGIERMRMMRQKNGKTFRLALARGPRHRLGKRSISIFPRSCPT